MLTTLTSVFVLVFSTPEMDTSVATYGTEEECEEMVLVMERHVSGASLYCQKIEDHSKARKALAMR